MVQPIKVLIIDDRPEFTEIVADRLRSWGFAAMEAHEPDEALANQATFHPQVAVLSARAKGGRALQLMGQLQAADPAVQVVLLLGKGAAIAGMRGMELGAADCIPLPLELGVLIDSIKKVTGSNQSLAVDETDP